MQKVILEIAKIPISFGPYPLTLEPILHPFVSRRKPLLSVQCSYSGPPSFKHKTPLYQRGNTYQFYRTEKGLLVEINPYALKREFTTIPRPLVLDNVPKAILLNTHLKTAAFFLKPKERNTFLCLLWHYIYLLISYRLLYRGQGFFVHAAGIRDRREGFLFVGPSGAGKSTIAKLFSQAEETSILGDDFMVICKEKRGPWLYGTPLLNASFPPPSREGAPLRKIFFLNHGRRNVLKKMNPRESLKRFLSQIPPILWVPEGLSFSATFSLDLCHRIPTYELSFVPDETIVRFLRSAL